MVTTSEDFLHSIVLVVSPLTSLMKDQVESFSKQGQSRDQVKRTVLRTALSVQTYAGPSPCT